MCEQCGHCSVRLRLMLHAYACLVALRSAGANTSWTTRIGSMGCFHTPSERRTASPWLMSNSSSNCEHVVSHNSFTECAGRRGAVTNGDLVDVRLRLLDSTCAQRKQNTTCEHTSNAGALRGACCSCDGTHSRLAEKRATHRAVRKKAPPAARRKARARESTSEEQRCWCMVLVHGAAACVVCWFSPREEALDIPYNSRRSAP